MTRPQKIAFYLPSLFGGGAERVVVSLANALAQRGYQVEIVVARTTGRDGQYVKDVSAAVRLVDLRASRLLFSLVPLIHYLRTQNPSVLISGLNESNLLALWAKLLSGYPCRLIISEVSSIRGQNGQRSLKKTILLSLMKLFYRFADGAVAVSKGIDADLQQIIGLDRSKITTIYNPLDVAKIQRLSQEAVDFPVSTGLPTILAVGRLTEPKDFPNLINAFALLRQDRPARLIILGEGALRPALEKLVRSHGLSGDILMPGFVANPYAWMRRADLFVLSSAWEGFPMVLLEAMACGTPVVSTDCPSGPAEILENGKWGQLVPIRDSAALAAAMLTTLNATARPAVQERAGQFGLDAAVEQYQQVLLGASPTDAPTLSS